VPVHITSPARTVVDCFRHAKTPGEGALTAMPVGYEVAESINGVVSVRRRTGEASQISEADVQIVRTAVAKRPHLSRQVVEHKGDAIIHEPEGGPLDMDGLADAMHVEGFARRRLEAFMARRPTRYTPVVTFEPASPVGNDDVASRMTYRGHGGWMLLSSGPLAQLVRRLVAEIGRESFFELL
jgi:hypothetical protein